ncbi:MAG: hypothetical protein ABIQ87_17540 [Rubrivivax sp.]
MPEPNLSDPALAARRTRAGRLKMLLVLAVCAAPVVASYLTYFVIRPDGRTTNYGALIQPTRGLPAELPLHALDGSAVASASLKGQWLLVAVGPSACGGACEKRLYMQRQLREMLGRESDRIDKLWLITDQGPLEPKLREATDAGAAVTRLRVDSRALAAWLAPAAGHALEDHLYLIDPMGEWMMRMPADADPAKVKRDLDRVLRASASWDTPGR